MTEHEAIDAFSALSQATRLRIVRLLVKAGSAGMPAGAIAEAMEAAPSNVSFHLSHLERAGLIASRRDARSIIYRADLKGLSSLLRFLTQDCCGGRPEICLPALTPTEACCAPETAA